MSRVFVDTSALITLLDSADPRHDEARSIFIGIAARDLVTHGYVVAESLAVSRRRFGVDGAMALLDDLLPVIELMAVTTTVHAAAQARYRDSLPLGISFVDQVSFAVMQEQGIDTAFALDTDFVASGVTVLPDPSNQSMGSSTNTGMSREVFCW